MFQNIKRGWEIGKATRKLVFQEKNLMIYPIISGIAVLAEILAIFIPSLLLIGTSLQYYYILPLFLFYFVVTFTATYILMAMFIAFRSVTAGNKITMSQAFSQVKPYTKLVIEWSLFYSVIIMIIRLIESRMRGISGIILGAVLSMAIGFATIFVVPVILDEKLTPIKAMKRSASFIIKNFGKSFGGLLYTDLYSLAIVLIGIVIGLVGIFVSTNTYVTISLLLVGGIILFIGIIINYLLSNVFKLIVYDFINHSKVPKGFSKEILSNAAKNKISHNNFMQPPSN
jgi:hypothetical protein